MNLTVTLEVKEATSMNAYVATPPGNGLSLLSSFSRRHLG